MKVRFYLKQTSFKLIFSIVTGDHPQTGSKSIDYQNYLDVCNQHVTASLFLGDKCDTSVSHQYYEGVIHRRHSPISISKRLSFSTCEFVTALDRPVFLLLAANVSDSLNLLFRWSLLIFSYICFWWQVYFLYIPHKQQAQTQHIYLQTQPYFHKLRMAVETLERVKSNLVSNLIHPSSLLYHP